jgi:large subunit ribosomal protein L25
MNEIELKVKHRQTGKHAAKKTRNDGLIPGVYYIKGTISIPIAVEPLDMRPVVFTAKTKMINLLIEGERGKKECVLKDVTFDPVTDEITHFDLVGVKRSAKMAFEIPITLKGQSIGVRLGGLLEHNLRKVVVHCLPKHMPNSIDVDITNLQIGKTIYLRDIKLENIEFGIPLDTVIAHVTTARVAVKEKAPQAAQPQATEPKP